ncbi:MAG: hypothetical protein K9N51_06345 [Candidatus Pacebacteria bacterium]|nr:hypothetical protein [Candidatus Paceibacterota bacterium]
MTAAKENTNTSRPARVHRHTLVEMNVSVFTGRRDAAHERVIDVLRREMLASSKELREKLYSFCGRLLEEAIESTQRSQIEADSPVLHYLTLLRDTIGASQALVRHEMTLVRESEEFSNMLNQYVVTQLQTANNVFSDSEMNILDCIEDLLKFGEPILARDTEERLAHFNEDDKARYNLALKEYRSHYAQQNRAIDGTHAVS